MAYAVIVVSHVCAVALSLGILLLAIYKRQAARSLFFTYLVLAIFVFNLGYLLEVSARIPEVAVLGKQIKYSGVPFIAPFLLLFVLEYCEKKYLGRPQLAALLAIPLAHAVMGMTWPWNGYYSHYSIVEKAGILQIETSGSIYYYLFYIYTYILTVGAIVYAVKRYRKGSILLKKQLRIIITATLIPGVGNAVMVFGGDILPFDVTSMLMSTTCVLLGYSFVRLGFFQIVPIAREQIVENMQDAFILVDLKGRFIDANASAKRLLPPLATAFSGEYMKDIGGVPWKEGGPEAGEETFEVLTREGEPQHFRVSQTEISHQNRPICSCIMLYDITESKRLLDEVSVLAEHDALTGLLNRGTFLKKGEQLFRQMYVENGSFSVLMMDLDHFKTLNDTMGHQMGDRVLSTIAEQLSAHFRDTDLFARYGGEEFVALLPRTSEAEIMDIAGRLCTCVRQIDWGEDAPSLRVTISIGAAVFDPAHHPTLDALILSADQALYAAKDAGRNAYVLANEKAPQTV